MRKAVLVFGELRKKSRFVQTKRTKLLVVFDCMYCCCICVCLYLVLSKFAEKLVRSGLRLCAAQSMVEPTR